jgi:hypothetical protein
MILLNRCPNIKIQKTASPKWLAAWEDVKLYPDPHLTREVTSMLAVNLHGRSLLKWFLTKLLLTKSVLPNVKNEKMMIQ